jgi:hypothetical protein
VKGGHALRIKTLAIAGVFLVALVAIAIIAVEARQRQLPQFRTRASPHETVEATIDGAALSITYGRPYMRGRTVMGGLVPYGRWWCPGADEATELTTSKALRIADLSVPAGTYTLYMLPAAGDWTLMINKRTGMFHTQYFPADDLGRITLRKRPIAAPIEQLTFAFDPNPSGSGGVLAMRWELTEVSAAFTVVR